MTSETVTIRCSGCGGAIITVPRATAEAFSSGRWGCGRCVPPAPQGDLFGASDGD